MSYEEFKKTIFYTRTKLIIPVPIRKTVNKTMFMVKGKYNFKKEEEFLREFYNTYIT